MINKLPVIENEGTSVPVKQSSKILHMAREAAIQSKSSEKIKRSLRHNGRTCSEMKFHTGECVFKEN